MDTTGSYTLHNKINGLWYYSTDYDRINYQIEKAQELAAQKGKSVKVTTIYEDYGNDGWFGSGKYVVEYDNTSK